MDAASTVQAWLEQLAIDHPRRSSLRHQQSGIVRMLTGLTPSDQAQVLEILEQYTIGVRTIQDSLTQSATLDEIKSATVLYEATREDQSAGDWGVVYQNCLELAQTFPDDDPADILQLLVEYRDCLQVDMRRRKVPFLTTVATAILELAEVNGCTNVGDALLIVHELDEAQQHLAKVRTERFDLTLVRPSRLAQARSAGIDIGDDDLGDK